MNNEPRFLDLAASWTLGMSTAEERAELNRLLREGGEEASALFRQTADLAVELACSLPPALPGPDLRNRILAAAGPSAPRRDDSGPGPRRLPGWAGWAVAASLAALLVTLWVTGQKPGVAEHWQAVTRAEHAQVIELVATEADTMERSARVTFDPTSRRAACVFHQFHPSTDSDYELWAIVEGAPAPVSLGLVSPDAQGHAALLVDTPAGTIAAFAVSREPRGGAPAGSGPTGPVIRAGSTNS